ncbi:MAG: GxxExxY protein [Gemmatimonadaceae bacterium]
MDTDSARSTSAILRRATTKDIIGAFFDVHRELGRGFLESVYRNALSVALDERGVPNLREAPLEAFFHGARVGSFKADLLVADCVIVEVKVAQAIDRGHEAQLLNYLRSSPIEVGMLLNFGPEADFRRLIYTNDRKALRRDP